MADWSQQKPFWWPKDVAFGNPTSSATKPNVSQCDSIISEYLANFGVQEELDPAGFSLGFSVMGGIFSDFRGRKLKIAFLSNLII